MVDINIRDSNNIASVPLNDYANLAAYDSANNSARPEAGDYALVMINGELNLLDSSGNLTAVGGSGIVESVAILRDEKSTGTNGGSTSGSSWNNRDLNTEVYDPDNIVSISSNQFTPVSGVYKIYAVASAKRAEGHRLRLYNVTQASVVQEGKNAISQDATNVPATNATLSHVFSANGTDAYRIDHYTTTSFAATGLGNAVSDGSNEVYMTILLEKIG